MRLLLGGAYFWEGAYYRSLISSLQQMRLLLGGAYYRGALIIGSLRYIERYLWEQLLTQNCLYIIYIFKSKNGLFKEKYFISVRDR